jgi:serine/threonine-protein kinase
MSEALPPVEVLPKEGDIVAGKYRIEKVLGKGGMGVVVAAQHTTLRQKVAIKLLLPEATKQHAAAARFLREAQAAASIQSEHIARVMDMGTLDNGAPYMVMEFLTGNDLRALLAERRTIPVPEVVDYLLQACEAIAEAHSIGIIHRDLKPANLFLTHRADGSALVKVLDFGLSKVTKADAGNPSLTAAGFVMGSPPYMSPEQIRSLKGLDARTDIWALGVILYQLLTGVRPFDSPSLVELFFAIGADAPKPMRQHRPDVPPELEAAVLKCLEKDPSRRHRSVSELAGAIAPFGNDESRISVERIQRVLSDAAPIARGSIVDDTSEAVELESAAIEMVGDAPTVAQGRARGGGTQRISPAVLVAPTGDSIDIQLAETTAAPPTGNSVEVKLDETKDLPTGNTVEVKLDGDQAPSGSMSAIAKDGAASPKPAPRSRAGLVIALVAVVAAIGGIGAFYLRTAAPPAPAPATTEAPPAAATVAPAPATAEAPAPPDTAAAAATAAPTTTTDAAPSGSVPAGKLPRPLVPKTTRPAPAKKLK